MKRVQLDTLGLQKFVATNELTEIAPMVTTARDLLVKGTGVEAHMGDWINLPTDYDHVEFDRIKDAARQIQDDSDVLIVIGIGGSYLGAKMALDFLHGSFFNLEGTEKHPQIFFAGNTISPTYTADLIRTIGDRDFSINVISKSGTTTEPAMAFRIFREKLIEKYGEAEANRRTYVTTDAQKGALHSEAVDKGFTSFVIPDGVGGRYSVLTPVGLLPIAASGIDIDALMGGAAEAQRELKAADVEDNDALLYAAYRNILYRKGYTNEILESYEPHLRFLAEWWKQLAGESEGKDHKGIYPSSAIFSTDLHSLGQYIQEGMRNLMETVVEIKQPASNLGIPTLDENLDGLQYLEQTSMDAVNKTAREAVVLAHTNGGVPNMLIQIEDNSAETLGYLIYFFEFAIATSGYLNGINPFNQPGVEDYKQNMFALLGKPGYEELRQSIQEQDQKEFH
ncbi:glucose-6-phosphate isomerase [Apilactobacillus apinorum]|uniref:Glucose-6-phosphate isomerase n=1 Tax=Apilactobacillus apinorum TaxID=1218495 RepID=A0ABP9ZHQ2_9LACO|nr:glucose-6-phosphate isomerase [Apilactobacillus apinorum]KOY69843.1 Glucose-6-phosphate isomerase [Apilactobacillus apinorum]CAI2613043.1 pgi Glucose-6-phosphate isomerase [Apilactobacillus apinorum]